MYPEILTAEQEQLLPLVKSFSSLFDLVEGTAVALQLGHRRSIDFDLFTKNNFANQDILKQVKSFGKVETIYVDHQGELTISINKVKFTFYQYPYPIAYPVVLTKNYSGNN